MVRSSPVKRTVSIHAANRNFYVVADPPFRNDEEAYDQLDFMATDIRRLRRSRVQVFIYPKERFGKTTYGQESGIQEYVEEIAGDVGGVAVPHAIHRINMEADNNGKK